MIHIPHIVALVLFLFFLSKVAKENFWILPCQCFPKSQVKKKKKKFLKVTKLQIIVEPCWISPNICLLFRWQIALRISLRTVHSHPPHSSMQMKSGIAESSILSYSIQWQPKSTTAPLSTMLGKQQRLKCVLKKKKKELYNII